MLRISDEAHRTDTGRQRHINEDAFFVRAPIYAVADGMGGAQAGEVASRIAASAFDRPLPEEGPPEERLRELVRSANREIHARAATDQETAGMGTTLTAAMVGDGEITLAHVGDSRAYVLRGDALRRLTHDHSLVDVLVRQGRLTPEEAENHPQRSIITRALGPEPDVQVDTQTVPARSGDVFVLCSDGLTTMIDERRIAALLTEHHDLQQAVDALVDEANRAGGRDNITVVAFRVEAVDLPGAEASTDPDTPVTETAISVNEVRAAVAQAEAPAQRAPVSAARGTRPGLRTLAKAALALFLIGVLVGAGILAARQVHFLGTDEAGRVAVYRGLPYELPAGLELYEKRYASPIQTRSLAAERRRAVQEHELRSRSDAIDLITDLERSRGLGS